MKLLAYFLTSLLIVAAVDASPRGKLNAMLDDLDFSRIESIPNQRSVSHYKFKLSREVRRELKREGRVSPDFGIITILQPTHRSTYPTRWVFTSVTGDIHLPNALEIQKYGEVDLGDWGLFTVDAEVWPIRDTIQWRLILFREAVNWMESNVESFSRKRMALGGYSGGSKLSVYLATEFLADGATPLGIFLGGCNGIDLKHVEKITESSPSELAGVPWVVSAGRQDRIATVEQSEALVRFLQESGFEEIHFIVGDGGHRLDPEHFRKALDLFHDASKS